MSQLEGNSDKALKYFRKSLDILKSDFLLTHWKNKNIGIIYFYKGDISEALELLNALKWERSWYPTVWKYPSFSKTLHVFHLDHDKKLIKPMSGSKVLELPFIGDSYCVRTFNSLVQVYNYVICVLEKNAELFYGVIAMA